MNNTIFDQDLLPLLRQNSGQLSAYLQGAVVDGQIDNTNAKAHCYFICLDGNLRPRVNDFARFLAKQIVDFAIPRSEINRAINEAQISKSTAPVLELNSKAKSLFSRLPNSGEGGEIILSIMAECFLKLPQIFTKMVLKTNPEMHVHGSDGIHAGLNSNGNLAIYWGESKLYSNVTDAVRECFKSLSPFLLGSGGSSAVQNRDLQLMRDGIDLDNSPLESAFKDFLNPDSSSFNKLEYRGLCLVGFDSDKYPSSPNSKNMKVLQEEIQAVFESRKKHINDRINEEGVQTFCIELFLLPFPNIEDFRVAFRREIGF